MPDVHAKLSASSSAQWLASPGTVWMEEGLPDDESPFAAEGTIAHTLVEIKLQRDLGLMTKSLATRRLDKAKKSEYYGKSMDEYTDEHVALVMEDRNAMGDGTLAMVEQRVDFSDWVPGGFGTSDTILLKDGLLSIWDLKYGKGVPVDAAWNPQLMLYALGAYAELVDLFEVNKVVMNIDQIRLGHVSQFELSAEELVEWADTVVKPAADAAIAGQPKFDFHDPHSWRFYKAAGFDRHLAAENLKIKKYKFKEGNSLSPDEIADILDQAPQIKRWLKAVEDYALNAVKSGELKVPGYKLVAGRSNRIIIDQAKAAELLKAAGFKDDQIYQPQALKTLTALEKVTGKKEFEAVLGEVVDKPEGKPALVDESDKRPELNSLAEAQADFDDDFTNE